MSSIIVEKNPKSVSAEAYRTLRTNLQFSSWDKDIKTLLITSAGPADGKSTTVANLAITMSQIGKKVLLIDCDMRRPSIHEIFCIKNASEGLTNLLNNNFKIEDVAYKYSSNLSVLTCGTVPQNPSDVLSSQRMKNMLNESKSIYDFIVMDSPPIVAVTDAQILAAKVDGVLLVINSSVSTIGICQKAISLLKVVNANILGAVINNAENKIGKEYGYYYTDNDDEMGS